MRMLAGVRFLVVMSMIACAAAALAEEAVELVNPGFEEAEGETVGTPSEDWEEGVAPPGWSVWFSQAARASDGKVTWETGNARSGQRCVSVSSAEGSICVMQQVPVEPGGVYMARCWVRTGNPASTTQVAARWKTAEGPWANSDMLHSDLPRDSEAGQWCEVELAAEVPENAAFLVLMLTGKDQGAEDICWLDDVSVARLTGEDLFVAACSWLHPMLHPVEQQIETPHIPWGRPLAGGPLSVLFLLGNDHNIREAQELAQRLEMSYDVAYAHEFQGLVYALNDREIRRKFAERAYDVIVVATRTGEKLGPPLARQVAEGRGVVLVSWPGMTPEIPDLELASAPEDHYLRGTLSGFPADPPELEEAVLKGVEVASGEGGGRAARVSWGVRCRCLTPQLAYEDHLRMLPRYWEAYLMLLGRSILWASGRETAATVRASYQEGGQSEAEVTGRRDVRLTVEETGWDYQGRQVADSARPIEVKAGQEMVWSGTGRPYRLGDAVAHVAVLWDEEGAAVDFVFCETEMREGPTRIESVELDAEYSRPRQTARARVVVKGAHARMAVEAMLTDAFGRVVHHSVTAVGDEGELTVAVPIGWPLSSFNLLALTLRQGTGGEDDDAAIILEEAALDEVRVPLLTPLPPERYFEDWRVSTWGSGNAMPSYLDGTFGEVLRGVGISSQLVPETAMLGSVHARLAPVDSNYSRLPGTGPFAGEGTVREPCFSDPEVRDQVRELAGETAAAHRKYGPIAAYLRDETSLARDDIEVCSGPHCARRYAVWLSQRYESIQALNEEWGTAYGSFREPGFVGYRDIRGKESFAPWLMFRRFMDRTWAESVGLARSGIRRGDPAVPVSYPNTFGPNPFCGRDYWLLSQVNDYSFEYPYEARGSGEGRTDAYHYEAVRCWSPTKPHLPWIGYYFEPVEIEYVPWWCALHGSSGVTIYGSMSNFAGKNSWAVLYPDLRPTRRGKLYEEVTRELRNGVGKLLMSARRAPAEVAILWSQPSMYVGWCLSEVEGTPGRAGMRRDDPYGSHGASRAAWMRLVTGSGRQYQLVCEELEEMRAQDMPARAIAEYDCLVLPAAYALEEAVARAAEELLARGGTVVADLGVGLTNGVGLREAQEETVERLFGIVQTGEPSWAEREITLPGGEGSLQVYGSAPIEVSDGEIVCSDADGVPLIVRKDHEGGGRAFYLNFAARRAAELLAWLESEGGPFAAVPRIADMDPAPDEPGEYELVLLEREGLKYLGVLHDHRFGLTEGPLTLRLPERAEVYEVRAGKHLGRTDTIRAELRPGQAAVYALLPYEVTGLQVRPPETARPGETCQARVRVEVSEGTPGDHVLRLEVRDPKGNVSEAYSRNFVAERGRGRAEIPFALNDEPGAWKVRVRDIASGREAESQVTLTPRGE